MYAPIEPALYLSNMESIYQQLKGALAPNGTLVWATTTPVPPFLKGGRDPPWPGSGLAWV